MPCRLLAAPRWRRPDRRTHTCVASNPASNAPPSTASIVRDGCDSKSHRYQSQASASEVSGKCGSLNASMQQWPLNAGPASTGTHVVPGRSPLAVETRWSTTCVYSRMESILPYIHDPASVTRPAHLCRLQPRSRSRRRQEEPGAPSADHKHRGLSPCASPIAQKLGFSCSASAHRIYLHKALPESTLCQRAAAASSCLPSWQVAEARPGSATSKGSGAPAGHRAAIKRPIVFSPFSAPGFPSACPAA